MDLNRCQVLLISPTRCCIIVEKFGWKQSHGEDQIPPKLVSVAANELTVPLTNAIDFSVRNLRFPENAKKWHYAP